MSGKREKATKRGTAASERKLNEITTKILLDERRHLAREAEDERLAKLEKISPKCAREISKGKRCGHPLNRHDPCSECPCPGFVDANKRDATAASEALIEKHPDLFPKARAS